MSKIAILAEAPVASQVVAAVAKILGLSIGLTRSRLETGKPLYEGLLFMNDHPEVADQLRSLVGFLEQEGVSYRVFELEEDEDFSSVQPEETEIDKSTLLNILSEWDSRNEGF